MIKTSAFDENVSAYDAWFDTNRQLYLAEFEAVRGFIPPHGTGVEIGVGTGRFAASLGITVGVEPSPGMAELARKRGVEVVEGVAESLPFGDETFDFALMVTVVCFLDDVTRAFRETGRILRPHGALIVGFIDGESELGRKYSTKKEESRFYRDATFFSVTELERYMRQADFSRFAYRQTLFPDRPDPQHVEDGHGKGSFVVVRAVKRR